MEDSRDKFYIWTDNRLKGSIAETIVEQMYSGYKVYRFGYEMVVQNLKDLKLKNGYVKDFITQMPDFIIVDNDGTPHLLEVKYRRDGNFDTKDKKLRMLGKSWGEARLILVSLVKPYFRISRIKDFIKTGRLYSLEYDKYIKVDKTLLRRYENLVEKYFKNK